MDHNFQIYKVETSLQCASGCIAIETMDPNYCVKSSMVYLHENIEANGSLHILSILKYIRTFMS